ncbi:MAG: hypothetical protein ACXWW9_05390 [Actinomycetota bacterium]
MARPPAVIFDLFGTLVHELPSDEFWASVDAIADAVGAERAAFRAGVGSDDHRAADGGARRHRGQRPGDL